MADRAGIKTRRTAVNDRRLERSGDSEKVFRKALLLQLAAVLYVGLS